MYTEHLSRALAEERQRVLSEEAATAYALRQARAARRRSGAMRRRSGVMTRWAAFLRSRVARAEAVESAPMNTASVDSAAAVAVVAAPTVDLVMLRGGATIALRTVEPSDGDLLLDGFARLSLRSRYARFLTAKRELTPDEVRYFTDLDHHDHEAICAIDPVTGRGTGIARFVRSRTDPQEAEVAVTVVDEWQRRGIGTILLTRLGARALEVGVFSFTAVVGAENEAMIGLLRNGHAGVELTAMDDGVLEYKIGLGPFTSFVDEDVETDAA